jgi:DNA-directed RNA polymerase specialized sigma24 family protein
VPGSAAETGAAGYRPLLFSIGYGMTGSVGEAKDIVQDAFVGLTRTSWQPQPGEAPVLVNSEAGAACLHQRGHWQ